MSDSIDNLIEYHVIKNIDGVYSNIKMTTKDESNRIHSKLYTVNINSAMYISFRINFDENGVSYGFVETNINDLFQLTTILNSLKHNLSVNSRAIEELYFNHLKNSGQNIDGFEKYGN